MASRKKVPGVEWSGALISMPAYVTGEGEPYRPDAIFWMASDGAMLGSEVALPGTLLARAAEILRRTIERPLVGPPRVPSRVRVASPALAEALRGAHPAVEIVCAPTPELDARLARMRETLNRLPDQGETYAWPGVPPDEVAAFFRAAADLFRAKPWDVAPADECAFAVDAPSLSLNGAALAVIGQMGQNRGLLLFSNIEDFEAYRDLGDGPEAGGRPVVPPHLSFNFQRGADLPAVLRREIAQNRWEVAAADAYPTLVVIDEDLLGRAPSRREVAIIEALALALPAVLAERTRLHRAWAGAEAAAWELTLPAAARELVLTLSAPHPHARPGGGDAGDRWDFDVPAFAPEDGLLELPENGGWIWAFTCPEQDCSCRFALVLATPGKRATLLRRGQSVAAAWRHGAGHIDAAARLRGVTAFGLDLDSLVVCSLDDLPLPRDTHPDVWRVVDRLNDTLLDAIGRNWFIAKGSPAPEAAADTAELIEVPGWRPGDLVPWDDVQGAVRLDVIVLGGVAYQAIERYCVRPGCACEESALEFVPVGPGRRASPGGVAIRGKTPGPRPRTPRQRNLLASLWAAFLMRHTGHETRFAQRRAIMHELGARIVGAGDGGSTRTR